MSQEDVQDMQQSGQTHRMSIALTIGVTVGVIGLILLLYGLFGHADYSRSDGINVNLWWGLLMFIVGIIMTVGGYISSRRQRQPAH
jgi:drug/metabolite transporter (DMT)-like permease